MVAGATYAVLAASGRSVELRCESVEMDAERGPGEAMAPASRTHTREDMPQVSLNAVREERGREAEGVRVGGGRARREQDGVRFGVGAVRAVKLRFF